jgi:hypothetical protein
MFGWLMERLFLDKKGRESRKKLKQLEKVSVPRAKAAEPSVPKMEEAPAEKTERDQIIDDAMAIFRQRRAEYEKLDGAVRDRIDKAASEAFGGKDK